MQKIGTYTFLVFGLLLLVLSCRKGDQMGPDHGERGQLSVQVDLVGSSAWASRSTSDRVQGGRAVDIEGSDYRIAAQKEEWSAPSENTDPQTDTVTVTDSPITRGTPITSVSSIANLRINIYSTGTADWSTSATKTATLTATNASGGFTTSPSYNWLTDLVAKTTLFAYTPLPSGTNGLTETTPYRLTYLVPTTVSNQPDLCAPEPELHRNVVNSDGARQARTFALQHRLTAVGFRMLGWNLKITDITVSGVYTQGVFDLSTSSWGSLAAKGSRSVGVTQSTVNLSHNSTPQNITQSNGYLMMIPQDFDDNSKVTITYAATTTNAESGTMVVKLNELDATWEAGDKVTYDIRLRTAPAVTNGNLPISNYLAGYTTTGPVVMLTDNLDNLTFTWGESWLKIWRGNPTSGTKPNGFVSGWKTGTGGPWSNIYFYADDENPSGAPRTATVTVTGTRSGKMTFDVVQVKRTPPFKINQPSSSQYVTIDGLKWTKGNLVAADVNQCKVGASTDYGLYFHYGSLIGWSGGANGDGTGTGTSVLTQRVISPGYTGSDTWPAGYYAGGSSENTGYALPSSDAPTTGIGDACRYYLGSPWRTPTADEYKALCNTPDAITDQSFSWSAVGGSWSNSPAGAYFASNQLFFPAAGVRTSALSNINSAGGYSSSSNINSIKKSYHYFSSTSVYPQYYLNTPISGTSRCVSGTYVKPFKTNPPSASQYVTIDGLSWTKGNLVAAGENQCKVGASTDYGLYFHFGSLIGWSGGANGDGTGTGSPTLTQKVISPGYSGSATWPAAYYTGGSSENTGYALPSSDAPTTGIGDACRYYLGSPWRTPTATEYKALCNTPNASTDNGFGWSTVGGSWGSSPAGGNFASNQLFFPGSGYRSPSSGGFSNVGSEGLYWSSSIYSNSSTGLYLRFSSNNVYPQYYYERARGQNLRCVSGTYVPPVPYVEVNGRKWTTGNLVADGANGCKVGSPTDNGLYFHFGSLIGWTGGANGDGTGTVTNVALSQKVKPSGYGGGTAWTTSGRYKDGTAQNTGYALPDSDAPSSGIGDACRYYLGSPWRTPTATEYKALCNTPNASTGNGFGWSTVGGSWGGSPAGGNFASNQLFFVGSGYRDPSAGALAGVGSRGVYWSSSVSSATYGLYLDFNAGYVSPQYNDNRVHGFTLRCVQ